MALRRFIVVRFFASCHSNHAASLFKSESKGWKGDWTCVIGLALGRTSRERFGLQRGNQPRTNNRSDHSTARFLSFNHTALTSQSFVANQAPFSHTRNRPTKLQRSSQNRSTIVFVDSIRKISRHRTLRSTTLADQRYGAKYQSFQKDQ